MFDDEKLRTYLGIGAEISRTAKVSLTATCRSEDHLVCLALRGYCWPAAVIRTSRRRSRRADDCLSGQRHGARRARRGQAVTYPPATVTGGASPVTTTCTPARAHRSPSARPRVACTAVDANVTSGAMFLLRDAHAAPAQRDEVRGVWRQLDRGGEWPDRRHSDLGRFIDPTATYPVLLQALLNNEYPGQSITVPNRGKERRTRGGRKPAIARRPCRRSSRSALAARWLQQPLAPALQDCRTRPSAPQPSRTSSFGMSDLIRTARRPDTVFDTSSSAR